MRLERESCLFSPTLLKEDLTSSRTQRLDAREDSQRSRRCLASRACPAPWAWEAIRQDEFTLFRPRPHGWSRNNSLLQPRPANAAARAFPLAAITATHLGSWRCLLGKRCDPGLGGVCDALVPRTGKSVLPPVACCPAAADRRARIWRSLPRLNVDPLRPDDWMGPVCAASPNWGGDPRRRRSHRPVAQRAVIPASVPSRCPWASPKTGWWAQSM